MVVFFSGTGNSRYAASMIADHIGDTLADAGRAIQTGHPAQLDSQLPWVFVSPTYGWRIPRIFADWLRQGQFTGSKEVYFVMTCGSDIGGAEKHLRQLCVQQGWHFRGVLEVVMPENYLAMFPVPDAAACAPIMDSARKTLETGIAAIQNNAPFAPRKKRFLDGLKSGLVNRLFYRFFVHAKPFHSTRSCASCGRCAQVCPLTNIQMVDGLPQWGEHCTHCMRCITLCPMKAIEYGKKSVGKPRYRCPEYKG